MTTRINKIALLIFIPLAVTPCASNGYYPYPPQYEQYEYDALNRLVRVYSNEYTEYMYDAVGNRVARQKMRIGQMPAPNPDTDRSGLVDFADLEELANTWLREGFGLRADLNLDRIVNFKDLAVMGDYWLGPGRNVLDLSREPAGPATNPSPPDGTVGVMEMLLAWQPHKYATSHDVYFGTTSPGAFQGAHTSARFTPDSLAPDTTYYWRIDEVNPFGTTAGPVWTFTTAPLPNPATDPSPADKADDVGPFAVLNWAAGSCAVSHNIYFGPNSPGVFQANQTSTTFTPNALEPNTTYYWRIDEVNPFGTTTGQVWTFTTNDTPPEPASKPDPCDGAVNIWHTPTLTWEAGADAVSHDVYFGTTSPGTFRGSQSSTMFSPGPLAPATTYYWRIDEVNPFGTTTGQVWSFTTDDTPPEPASSPDPCNGTSDIGPNAKLSWQAGFDAVSHDVYFGTTSPGTFKRNQTSTTFWPQGLSAGTTYYWRIDEVNPFGTTTGEVWSFTTADGPIGSASAPDPCDGAVGIGHSPILRWQRGFDASSHDVYFGTTSPGAFQRNLTSTMFSPGPLAPATTYYWRIDEVNPFGTKTGQVWTFTTGDTTPEPASGPDPCDGAVGIGHTPTLRWQRGFDASSHDVYFGTTSPGAFQGNQTSTQFRPGTLSPATTYYWRIDEVNPFGTTTGQVWSFTTDDTPPEPASGPDPCDGAVDIGHTPTLSWKTGFDAVSHDVYFGTTSPGAFQGNQTSTTFRPGSLAPATTYYWRIDEVNPFGTTTGQVWSFTTDDTPPEPASGPDPYDGAVEIGHAPTLSWQRGFDASSHDVYFGTTSPGAFRGNQTSTRFRPGTLLPATTYYWRIDEVNPFGTTAGQVWSFTTTDGIPRPASSPDPCDGAVNVVGFPTVLNWQAGLHAASYDVYFGTSSPGTFQGNQTSTTFTPRDILPNTTYYWRVDGVSAFGKTAGQVWSFTTAPAPTGPVTNPHPPDGATEVRNPISLSWNEAPGATSGATLYRVWLGKVGGPNYYSIQTETTFEPGNALDADLWNWRVDTVSDWGVITGPSWTFTTGPTKSMPVGPK